MTDMASGLTDGGRLLASVPNLIDLRSGSNEAVGVRGYVPGAWDMFHIGHLNILKRARRYCDYLVVGAVSDEALFEMKGKYPVVALSERMEILEAIGIVDEVVPDFSIDKRRVWQRVRFDVLFKGDDWKGTAKGHKLEGEMAEIGARVHYFPYTRQTSSTELRRALVGY